MIFTGDIYHATHKELSNWYDENIMPLAMDNVTCKVNESSYAALKEIFFHYAILRLSAPPRQRENQQEREKYDNAVLLLKELATTNKTEGAPASPHLDKAFSIIEDEIEIYMRSNKWYKSSSEKKLTEMLSTDGFSQSNIRKDIRPHFNKKIEDFRIIISPHLKHYFKH